MSGGLEASQRWVDVLTAAGVNATTSPGDFIAPGVLFEPGYTRFDLGEGWTAEMRAVLAVPGPLNSAAWKALDELTEKVTALLPAEHGQEAQMQIDNRTPTLPARRLTWEEAV